MAVSREVKWYPTKSDLPLAGHNNYQFLNQINFYGLYCTAAHGYVSTPTVVAHRRPPRGPPVDARRTVWPRAAAAAQEEKGSSASRN